MGESLLLELALENFALADLFRRHLQMRAADEESHADRLFDVGRFVAARMMRAPPIQFVRMEPPFQFLLRACQGCGASTRRVRRPVSS